jgi:hypothetical protein
MQNFAQIVLNGLQRNAATFFQNIGSNKQDSGVQEPGPAEPLTPEGQGLQGGSSCVFYGISRCLVF